MERGGDGAGPSGAPAAELPDAPFRSAAVAEKVRQQHLWHGDLLADGASFGAFRAWLEERLPRVTQTPEGYFTAALVRCARFLRSVWRAPLPWHVLPAAPTRRAGGAHVASVARASHTRAALLTRSVFPVPPPPVCFLPGGCEYNHHGGAGGGHLPVRHLPLDARRQQRALRAPARATPPRCSATFRARGPVPLAP
jgi:hypothetical protein